MTTKETFAQRLFELRESSGITRQQFADDLNITRSSLEFYEKGKRTPDIDMIAKIAKKLDVTTDYLFGLSKFQTTDITEKAVCEYTGLSESVIKRLHKWMPAVAKKRINKIFSCFQFDNFLGIIDRRKEALTELVQANYELADSIVGNSMTSIQRIGKAKDNKTSSQNEYDLQTFRLTQTAIGLSDEYMPEVMQQYWDSLKRFSNVTLTDEKDNEIDKELNPYTEAELTRLVEEELSNAQHNQTDK